MDRSLLATAADESADKPAQALEAALTALSDQLMALRSATGRVLRARDGMDVLALRVRVPSLLDGLDATRLAVADAHAALSATPPGAALSEDYPQALESEFRRAGLEFEGAFPEYEIFPLTVRVNVDGESVRIGRRTVQTLDPRAVARAVQKDHRRLHGSSFNAPRFLDALALCYDALSGGQLGSPVPLIDVYRLLSARTGATGYTRQEFAFDIYRVRRQSDLIVKGRTVEFSHGKSGTQFPVPRTQGGAEIFRALILRKALPGG
jgi:hypothetical protein